MLLPRRTPVLEAAKRLQDAAEKLVNKTYAASIKVTDGPSTSGSPHITNPRAFYLELGRAEQALNELKTLLSYGDRK